MVLDEQQSPLHPGCCWIIKPGSQPHATHQAKNPLTVLSIHLDFLDDQGSGVSEVPELPMNRPIQVPEVRRLNLLSEYLVGTGKNQLDQKLGVWQLLHLLQHPTSGVGAKVDERIQRSIRRMAGHLAHSWTTKELATIATLSPGRFTTLFREQLGMTPKQYLIAARMKRASTLLLDSQLTQAEIADNLGFTDVYFFNRQFTQFHGMPPGRYRKTHAP